ncbi:hypothetical protein EJ06DRAFT_480744 [Trichodelitschia bisporula]|uniref:AAA+ ATPase domain-containing protein n=1 Tax=Trichodelitschia bisporula TaxID=703511 RepID=A0A6G1HQA4_9PEZI|nr:hypothetical protein EJ06DRAFT_480744 [Trichodelitschia bisporula]
MPYPPGPEDEDKSIKSYERRPALEHFRALIQFVDKYFAKQLSLLKGVKAGKVARLAFDNLWMLFDSGDNIYSSQQQGGQTLRGEDDETHVSKRRDVPQAYRVLATIGGVPLQKILAPRSLNTEFDAMDDLFFAPYYQWRPRNNQFRGLGTGLGQRADRRLGGQRGPVQAQEQPKRNYSQQMKGNYSPLYVHCFYIDFDGTKYGTVTEIFQFKPYDDEVEVRSLEAFPLQYLDPNPAAFDDPERSPEHEAKPPPELDMLLERGKKFIDSTVVSHMAYDGQTVGESREEISSPVIVDMKLAFQEAERSLGDASAAPPEFTSLTKFWPRIREPQFHEFIGYDSCTTRWCQTRDHQFDHYERRQKKLREKMEPKIKSLLEEFETDKADHREGLKKFKEYMEEKDLVRLLPGVVRAFALRNRKWVQVDLRKLQYIKQADGWNDLVLPKGHRKMVQAMVETHTSWSNMQRKEKVEMDLVQGKGKGCIILLHGAPGVGKTSTAECVAAYTQRPLYPITCGDIGYLPEIVEKNMERHFRLAHKWGCVLLLDEADVFLAKRSKDDVKRNGLVSVFLRILEYYSGILFLTTNRVGAIDDAFRSRLHLTLYYPKLSKSQTIKIWKTNLDRLIAINETRAAKGLPPVVYDKKKIIKWAKKYWDALNWNGRQIRNAFQTAVALGEFANTKGVNGTPGRDEDAQVSPIMDVEHFEIIARASIQFNDYLLLTHGADEDKMAKRDMVRTTEPVKSKLFEFEVSSDEYDSDSSDESEENDSESSSSSDSDASEKKKRKKKKAKAEVKDKKSKGKEKTKDKKKDKKKEK